MMRRQMDTCGAVLGMMMVLAMPVRAETPGSGQQGAAGAAAATTGPAQVPASGPVPKLRVDERVYNFGEVMDGTKVEHDFAIINDGEVTLEIPSVRTSCGCTATEWDRKIEPGKKGKVHVVFNTRGKGKHAQSSVYVQTNDPANQRIDLRMEGSTKQMIDMDPPGEVRFGRVGEDKIEPAKVKVTSNLPKPIKLQPMPSGAQADAFKVSVREIEPGKVFEVTVAPQPPFPEGEVDANLQFSTGVTELPTVGIRASLFFPPAIEVPTAIILGAPPARETPRHIDLAYNGKGEIKVLSASSSDPAIKTNVLELTAGRRYRVLCQIPAGYNVPPGQKVEIKIATDYAAKKEIVVPVTMASAPQPVLPPVNFTVAAQSLIGKKAPDVTIRSFTNRQVKVNDVTAIVKVLDFWALNCPQCMRQLPMVQRLFEQYQARGVEFLLINADRVGPPSEAVNKTIELRLTMEMASDREMAASVAYGASSLPALYLIGKSGQIEAVHIGLGPGEAALKQLEKDITTELDLLLAGKTHADFPTPSSAPANATPVNAPPAALRNAKAVPDRPVFEIISTAQNLGKRAAGEQGTYDLYFRNGGGRPLEIAKVSTSLGATVNPGYAKTIAPGAAGMIQVGFTAPTQPGPFSQMITIESNDPNRSPATVTSSGQVRPYIEIEPAGGADFSRRRETHARPCSLKLTYTGTGPIQFISAVSNSPKFEVELRRVADANFAGLIVRAKPPFDPGENKGAIRVTTDCPQQQVVEVPVRLYMPSRIEVTPAELLFMKGPRQALTRAVTINNYGDKPISILAVRRSQDKLMTQFFPGQDGWSYQLRVTVPADFVPAAGGDRVVIQTDDPEYKEIVIPVSFRSPGQMR